MNEKVFLSTMYQHHIGLLKINYENYHADTITGAETLQELKKSNVKIQKVRISRVIR